MPEQQLRIGVIGARGIFDMQGGVETYCSSFYRRLDPDLFSITIFASRSRVHAPLPPNLTVVRVPAPALRSLETPVGALLGVMLARLCGIRLVHVHGLSSCICLPLARMLGMSIVVRHMGAEYRRAKWGAAARAVLQLGETFAARFADTVICLNDDIRREFSASTGRRHGLHVIANGVDPPPATCPRALHQELGLEPGGYVLGVGRLVPEKQFDTLIGAFLRADLPQRYKLVIVGAAAHSEKHVRTLRSLAGGSERVVFAGERFGADLWVLYRQCAMFVLPSTHEGMSFSLLEASGAGAMVIASDIRANATVCGDYGVLFPVGSAAALADAITAGAASVRTQEEIDRQILVCKTRHDWNAIARLTEAVFLDTHRSRQVERRGVPHAVGGAV
jgi:glycosyltransferase involved in cell wall biosynthesis